MSGDPWDNDEVVKPDAPATRTYKAPDGSMVALPADASPDQVQAVMAGAHAQAGGGGSYSVDPQAGDAPWTQDQVAPENLKDDQGAGFIQGFLKPGAQALRWLDNGIKGIPGVGDAVEGAAKAYSGQTLTDALGSYERYADDLAVQGKRPGSIGKFAGELVGSAPVALVPGGAAAQGAVGGALLSDAKDARGLALDAGLGAAGGKAGEYLTRGISGIVAPVIRDSAQALLDEGVRLTPGQIAGGAIKRTEDALSSVPLVGDLVKSAQAQSFKDFNRAAVNRTLAPIGETLPSGVATGHDAVGYAADKLSAAYNDLLPKLAIKSDDAFKTGLTKVGADAMATMPQAQADQFQNIVRERVLKPLRVSPDGPTMKAVDSDVGALARKYGASPDAAQAQLGEALSGVRDELRALVVRSNPAQADRLNAINTGYANLVRVQRAAGAQSSTGGVFTPAQLSGAVRAGDASGRKAASSRGAALMQDLSDAGREVLPSSVPDSGTPMRSAMMLLGGAALGGHAAHVPPEAMFGAAALAAPYLRPGQSAIRALMTTRPQAATAAAQYLRRLAPVGAAAGAAGAVQAGQALLPAGP